MLKMNDLVNFSQTPKSTILYYVKEGLLPEPLKDKPNFHLYDERCVSLLAFIKYLQVNFNASISQIKQLFAHPNFDWQNPYESLISLIGIIMGAENEIFSPEELCREFDITENELNQLVSEGFLNPREGIFTGKERDILAILCRCNEAERAIVQTYLDTAKQLALQEVHLTHSAIADTEQKNDKLKHLFDILLVVKPYILNMRTLAVYQQENPQ